MTKLKFNIIANYFSQGYRALIGILMMPLYLSILGAESLGVIGFYIMLQSWLQILDIGMKPAISREASKYKAETIPVLQLKDTIQTFNVVFLIIAIFIFLLLYFNSEYLSTDWLKISQLNAEDVSLSIKLIAMAIALKWLSGLYVGVINGLENQVQLNIILCIFSTFRFVFVLIPLNYIDESLKVFFYTQLLSTFVEFVTLKMFCNKLCGGGRRGHFSIRSLKTIFSFSSVIAFSSIVWVVVTQVDKLILSKNMSLDNYGYFSLAILVSNVLLVIGTAISPAILPRMTILKESSSNNSILNIYSKSLNLVMFLTIPMGLMFVFFGKDILYVWTGDNEASEKGYIILLWYTLGNLCVVFSAFPYYLQYAYGNLKMHFIGNIIYAVILIPVQVFLSSYYTAVETGIAWFSINFCILIVWLYFIHNKFLPGYHFIWLLNIFVGIIKVAFLLSIVWFFINIYNLQVNLVHLVFIFVLINFFYILTTKIFLDFLKGIYIKYEL